MKLNLPAYRTPSGGEGLSSHQDSNPLVVILPCTRMAPTHSIKFEFLKIQEGDIQRDAAIQRFEFTLDLAWKTIEVYLEKKGIACSSPKDCFRAAFKHGLLSYSESWLDFVDLRNQTSHTYRDDLARLTYLELPKVEIHIASLIEALEKSLLP
ncbi:MAG: nucleotidyltransferase [Candidatus Omnitrophica bacterium]|nr:nucleotidyltransferase [Candidatus Omnitrophota bacterium]